MIIGEIGHASKLGHYVNHSIECHLSSKVHLSLKKKKNKYAISNRMWQLIRPAS